MRADPSVCVGHLLAPREALGSCLQKEIPVIRQRD